MKIVQKMKIEIDPLKKTQTKFKLKMKNLWDQTKASEVSLPNSVEDIEVRILSIEDKVEEMDT